MEYILFMLFMAIVIYCIWSILVIRKKSNNQLNKYREEARLTKPKDKPSPSGAMPQSTGRPGDVEETDFDRSDD